MFIYSEQMIVSPSMQFVFFFSFFLSFILYAMIGLSRSSALSPRGVQHVHEKQQENIERFKFKFDYVEDANQIERKKDYKPVTIIKQARMLLKHFHIIEKIFLKCVFCYRCS